MSLSKIIFRGDGFYKLLMGLFLYAATLNGYGDSSSKAFKDATASGFYGIRYERTPSAAELTVLGQRLFNEPALSASGKQSCASCHSPDHAFAPSNTLPVQPGGVDLQSMGTRAVPSLKYLQNTPVFTEHFYETDGNDSVDQGPVGGLTWDGRVNQLHEQAVIPLLSPIEMANTSPQEVILRLRNSAEASLFRQTFGAHVLETPNESLAWNGMFLALEVYQQNPAQFYPYNSKYDAWLRHQVELTPQEMRGLKLFNDPERGNCAACHVANVKHGSWPQFTDYGMIALGVPRNPAIAANYDPHYFDLGLCGPARTDLRDHPEYCGRFKTPSLRNVALKKSYFHNGVMHDLKQVLRFYSERDVHPEKFYPKNPDGSVNKFDDLPARYHSNLDTTRPFDRSGHQMPHFTEAEIEDLIAFLHTLTDGYRP